MNTLLDSLFMDITILAVFITPVLLIVLGIIIFIKTNHKKNKIASSIGALFIIFPSLFLLYLLINMFNFFSGPPPTFHQK